MKCKKCGSNHVVAHGVIRNKARYLCKDCGCQGVNHPNPVGRPQESHPNHHCFNCGSNQLIKNGKSKTGLQYWKCKSCGYRSTRK